MAKVSDNGRHASLGLGVRCFVSEPTGLPALVLVADEPVRKDETMSNMNFNGGRGGLTQTKATSVSEHKFGGSHAANTGGSKRGDAPVKGSHAKGGGMKRGGC